MSSSFDIVNILKSWITAINPSEIQSELAQKRFNECMVCDFRKELIDKKEWSMICGPCGCPIKKKIFTDQYGSCPKQKWNNIENEYKILLKQKIKSII